MSTEDKVSDRTHESALVLANAGELAVALVKNISGKDVSASINGSALTRELTRHIVQQGIAETLTQKA